MTHRERFLACCRGEPVDRIPDFEFGAWEQTIARWHAEGLPETYQGVWAAIDRYIHSDSLGGPETPWVTVSLCPQFEARVLEVRGDHEVFQDNEGVLFERMRPELGASIPKYLRFPIESRADWERLRDERLDPKNPARWPSDMNERASRSRCSEWPVGVYLGSLYGELRNWMGVERLSEALYEEPEWVEEMMEHMLRVKLEVLGRIAGHAARIDHAMWWEDMCYKAGPLLSPSAFQRLMVPRYRMVTDYMREEFGTSIHFLDCDGNIHHLAALWLAAGINGMFPLEAGPTDPYRIRSELGPSVALRGGYDKKALAAGGDAIDREFERLMPLIREGGFIPHVDHLVPPDVSFENYRYYRRRKCEIIGKPYVDGS
jgi:uroporphyrinogen decarboxylase